jgi:hypothetical protein
MAQVSKTESDKKSTDMTDDVVMNEVFNNGGRQELSSNDATARTAATSKAKKIRKLVGMC